MKANLLYLNKGDRFWALVKMVSEKIGYSERTKKGDQPRMKRYTEEDIYDAHIALGAPTDYFFDSHKNPTPEALEVLSYLKFRAEVIENDIRPNLMDRKQAKDAYEKLLANCPQSKVKVQMNKQKGDKRHPSYLVNIVNLIAEKVIGYGEFNDDPMKMGLIIDEYGPLKTLCRRMDGAYPNLHSPKILWEVKEYYGTKTFGSRIADGVYETMLVGEELQDIHTRFDMKINHALFVDDYFTWWTLGRSYLCRLVDILHMGYADRVFFGREALTEWESYLTEIIDLPRK